MSRNRVVQIGSALLIVLTMVAVVGCGAGPQADAAAEVALHCSPQQDPADRVSPYDSVSVSSGALQARICYGRPSSRGRTMLGGELVPFGQLWRTGANEPTIIHLSSAAEIAGIGVAAGSYSLYTIPDESEWTVIVNGSITQWGHESTYRGEVAAAELGRATVAREVLTDPVETFTIRSEPAGPGAAHLILEWETSRVVIPVVAR